MQFGFIEGGSCNFAKIQVWYNAFTTGANKSLLIDIKNEFDSINRNKLREMIEKDFQKEERALILSFIDIYDTIEIDIQGEKIFPTKGGPQGSSIIPSLFCYYLNNNMTNINIKENISIQAYADDIIIQANSIKDLTETYSLIKASLSKIDLIINPEKCELLSNSKEDYIFDDETGITITTKQNAKYLGLKINNSGIAEQIIEEKVFGQVKSKLNKYHFLTRLSRIRLFKTYMISKVNHLLPLIALNGHLQESWKYIRRIIFRDILRAQTSPLESMVTLGLGYYNIIIKPILKIIEKFEIFQSHAPRQNFLIEAAKKALTHWKSLEQKIPKEIDQTIDKLLKGEIWLNSKEMDILNYNNLGEGLFKNSNEIKEIKDARSLKYPNYIRTQRYMK